MQGLLGERCKIGSTMDDVMPRSREVQETSMRQTKRLPRQLLMAIGASALGLVCIAGPGWGQSVQDQKRAVEKRLQSLKEALEEKRRQAPQMLAEKEADQDVNALASRLLDQAKDAEKKVPSKIVLPPPPRAVVPSAVYEQEDSFERLRRNQKALTEQRIGDIIILRGNQ